MAVDCGLKKKLPKCHKLCPYPPFLRSVERKDKAQDRTAKVHRCDTKLCWRLGVPCSVAEGETIFNLADQSPPRYCPAWRVHLLYWLIRDGRQWITVRHPRSLETARSSAAMAYGRCIVMGYGRRSMAGRLMPRRKRRWR